MKKKRAAVIFLMTAFVVQAGASGCTSKTGGADSGTPQTVESVSELPQGTESQSEPVSPSKPETAESSPQGTEADSGITAPHFPADEFPKVDGSTATIPLSVALYQVVTGAPKEEAEGAVVHTKTTNAYLNLIEDYNDLVIAYEPSQTVYDAMEQRQVNLMIKPIGKDALVFMANEGNPVTSLSESQLVDIYSGCLKNWSLVGGADKEIMAFQRPVNSGSQTLMEKLVMKGVPMQEAPVSRIVGEMDELIEQVASYNNQENALGYSVYFYARNMYQKPGLRFMAVDGIMPDNSTIKSGTYPYVNEFYAAIREDEPKDSRAYELFQWLTTEDGQALIEELGYVGLQETTKSVQVDLGYSPEERRGNVHIGENQRMLVNGYLPAEQNGVAVLNGDWEIEKILDHKRINGTITVEDMDHPVAMTDLETGNAGLYRLKDDRWVLEPKFYGIYQYEPGVYRGYLDGPYDIIWDSETETCQVSPSPFNDYEKVGDYFWHEEDDQAEIITKEGEVINTVRLKDYGLFLYGYPLYDYYVATYEDDGQMVFDQKGNLIYGRDVLGDGVRVNQINPYGQWIFGSWNHPNENRKGDFIYSFKYQKIISQPGDAMDENDVTDENGAYTAVRDGKKAVYDEDGRLLSSSEGKAYDRIVGRGYYGRVEDGRLVIENTKTNEQYQMPCSGDYECRAMKEHVFYLCNEDRSGYTGYYWGNQQLIKNGYITYWPDDGYMAFSNTDDQLIVINPQGDIVYNSMLHESLIQVLDDGLAVRRGNYLYILDFDGNCVFHGLQGSMGDD